MMVSARSRISILVSASWCRGRGQFTEASRGFARRSERRFPAQAVLDGEIVYLDADGKPQFYELMRRRAPQHYYAFDVLWLDGRDLRDIRLIERKRLLRRLVRPPVLYSDHFEARGVDLFKAACDNDLEGIVAKLAAGRYEPAATTWVKIKNPTYSQAEGRADFFDPAVRSVAR